MRRFEWLVAVLMFTVPTLRAELKVLTEVPPPPPVPTGAHVSLPQKHEYQKQLRAFMVTLMEADFVPSDKELTMIAPADGAVTDDQFRAWLFSISPPSAGYKRNYGSLRVHPALFTVPVIENEKAILRPLARAEPQVELADWNYPGNPHFNSRALRLRAFVLCSIDMMMLDELIETGEEKAKPNQDQIAAAVLRFAYAYPGFRAAISDEAQRAYLVGLMKHVQRLLVHGPKVLPRTLGLFTTAAPALALASKELNDPEVTSGAEAYARALYTDPRFFREAGYFPFGGTLDSFNGIALCYAVWGASAGEWPFAREAIAKAYRLRAHLTLPEPDGFLVGPSHMAALTPVDPAHDQWNWPSRAWGAAVVSDEAACLTKMPDEAAIRSGAAAAAASIQGGIRELPWTEGGLDPKPWTFTLDGGVLGNPGYVHYAKDYYKRRSALEKTEMAKLPVLRNGDFVRRFSDEFLVAKSAGYAAIVHTGPITDPSDADAGFGFGGGALSAFWTPKTGSVILGRGVGAWSPTYKKMFDSWRSIPTHAVTGVTAAGKVFTSGHIAKPEATFEADDKKFVVVAHGLIPPSRKGDELFEGTLEYTRRFESAGSDVRVTTTVKSDSPDAVAELYETIPVFLRDESGQPNVTPTTFEFQIGGKWTSATETLTGAVTAVRLHRFDGAVDVVFDRPARVKLAPVWLDGYMSKVSSRNVLIDLIGADGTPGPIVEPRQVSYRIKPAG